MSEQTVAEYEAALKAEWGTYVALKAIDVNGARVANPGDAVPVSHVEAGLVPADAVAKSTTKAAAAVTEEKK